MMSNVKLYWNRLLLKLYRSNYTYPTVSNAFLPEASFGPRVLSIVVACVCVSVCPCVRVCINHLLVRAITRDPFKLGSPNFDQRCKTPWLRSLLFLGAIDLDPQGQIWLKFTPFWACPHDYSSPFKPGSPNLDQRGKIPWLRSLLFWGQLTVTFKFLLSPLLEIHNLHITTREPWVPRLLHRPDCFMVFTLFMYLYI